KYLVSGVQIDDEYKETVIGTPQGGNLSPLLSNIMLNELDKELENRGLRFVRYADDCIIMVKSEMAARRVMRSVTKYIEEKLGLVVNVTKSKVSRHNNPDMKFLGFGLFKDYQNRIYKAKTHQKSVENFKYKLKQLTRKNWSVDTKYQVERINQLLHGWTNDYKVGLMNVILRKIDTNMRESVRV